jgi:hypothetical protein
VIGIGASPKITLSLRILPPEPPRLRRDDVKSPRTPAAWMILPVPCSPQNPTHASGVKRALPSHFCEAPKCRTERLWFWRSQERQRRAMSNQHLARWPLQPLSARKRTTSEECCHASERSRWFEILTDSRQPSNPGCNAHLPRFTGDDETTPDGGRVDGDSSAHLRPMTAFYAPQEPLLFFPPVPLQYTASE